MKKSFIFYFFLITTLTWTACGGDNVINQLQTEQAELVEEANKTAVAVERFRGEFTQLNQLAADVAAQPQVKVLISQYSDIFGSLENMQQWYQSRSEMYGGMIESQQAGTLAEAARNKQIRDIQEKAEAMKKKAGMTITELERMRGEIETAVQNAKAAMTPTEGQDS